MSSIIENALSQFDDALTDYAQVFQEPVQILKEREQELREEGGTILPFSDSSCLDDKTLVAIDGGRASEQLSGGDIIAVAATLADGISSKPLYGDSGISETSLTIVPHSSQNDSAFGARVMASLELRVLELAGADHIIIDGAYLGNTSEVLFGLLGNNEDMTRKILHADRDGKLSNAITRILKASESTSTQIIAVPKSDSSYVQSKLLLKDHPLVADKVSDRMLATTMLNPGEFLVPRFLETNPFLLSSLKKWEDGKMERLFPEAESFLKGKLADLTQLGGGKKDRSVPNKLYTTYFKPTGWSKEDRALRVEFISPQEDTVTVNEQARKVVEIVNADTVSNAIMEPYSQFVADRRAKEIGLVIDILKQRLVAEASTNQELSGLLRNYRT